MPPRKKGRTGRGAAAQEAPEEPAHVAEDAPAPAESKAEAETTGNPSASEMDMVVEVYQPAALFHYCISLL